MTHAQPETTTILPDVNLSRSLAPASGQYVNLSICSPYASPAIWDCGLQPLLLEPNFEDNDFQSSAYYEHSPDNPVHRLISEFAPSLAGLGMHYTDSGDTTPILCPAKEDPQFLNTCNPLAQPPGIRRYHISRTATMFDCQSYSETTRPDVRKVNNSAGSLSPELMSSGLCPDDYSTNLIASSLPPSINDSNISLSGVSCPDDTLALSLERLSAATGMTVDMLAAEISASAEATLRQLASDNNMCSTYIPGDILCKEGVWRFLDCTGDLTWPTALSNTESTCALWSESSVGINPADIMPPLAFSARDVPPVGIREVQGNNFSDICAPIDPIRDVLSRACSRLTVKRESEDLNGDNKHSIRHDSDMTLTSSPDVDPRGRICRVLRSSKGQTVVPQDSTLGSDSIAQLDPGDIPKNLEAAPAQINLGTPVFDAHRGIDLQELRRKAERYRHRNQGQDYNKQWLISFAGKLTARGELTDEFRCYVIGCYQTNKRRDHILIHVGAHLDQRPFKCSYCPSRFLRKNERKRHELSHSGKRPFSCHLCPVPTTFVRQDLLKRHIKRAHPAERIKHDSAKENEEIYDERPAKRGRRR